MTSDQAERAVKALERIADAMDALTGAVTGESITGIPIQIFSGETCEALRVVLVNGAAADLEPGEERE